MTTRVLCLGNALLADDALGPEVAARLRSLELKDVEVVETAETGFYLLDHVLGCTRLVVIDTVVTGSVPPGAIRQSSEQDLRGPFGGSPHYVGLFETLAAGRQLGLPVPGEVIILAVEGEDLTSVGGAVSPAVRRAIPEVVRRVLDHWVFSEAC